MKSLAAVENSVLIDRQKTLYRDLELLIVSSCLCNYWTLVLGFVVMCHVEPSTDSPVRDVCWTEGTLDSLPLGCDRREKLRGAVSIHIFQ